MNETPRSNRLHIGVFGRVNAGKSSIINMIARQPVAIVSDGPGTTSDPVFKNMELLPLGPVTFIDTAGFGDLGAAGELREARTRDMFDRTDVAIVVLSVRERGDVAHAERLIGELASRGVPTVGALSKIDLVDGARLDEIKKNVESRLGVRFVPVSAESGEGRADLLDALIEAAPRDLDRETLIGDLIEPGARVLLVAPQDKQAPKGRLILPQAQTIRDALDHGAVVSICTPETLGRALEMMREPDLVITDSQIFAEVEAAVPSSVRLTSFSILMARAKGDLATLVRGARALRDVRPGDRVLIAEACTHHEMDGDIARVKLPAILRRSAGGDVQVDVVSGPDLPADASRWALAVHCGACMFTRRQMMQRLARLTSAGVPVANFGTLMAEAAGILDRATAFFPELA